PATSKPAKVPTAPPTWVESTPATPVALEVEPPSAQLSLPEPVLPAPATIVPPTTPAAAPTPFVSQENVVAAAVHRAGRDQAGGPSLLSTLFWMALTAIVVVVVVLVVLQLMTGVLR